MGRHRRRQRGQARDLLAWLAALSRLEGVSTVNEALAIDESSLLQSSQVVQRRQEAHGAIIGASGELAFFPEEKGDDDPKSGRDGAIDAVVSKAEQLPWMVLATGDRKLCNGSCSGSGTRGNSTRPASVVVDHAGVILDSALEASRRTLRRENLGNEGNASTVTRPWVSVGYRAQQLFVFGSWIVFFLLAFLVSFIATLVICNFLGPCVVPLFPNSKTLQNRPRLVFSCCALGLSLVLTFFACLTMHFGLRHRLEFIHIPKNAGTSVEQLGRQHGVYWGESSARFWLTQRMPDGSRCNRYHIPPPVLRRSLGRWPYDYATTFCVTRHPMHRIVSEYKYLSTPGLPHARRMYETYHNGVFDYPSCTELGLNHFVHTVMTQYLEGNHYFNDCHIVPMSNFVWDDDGNRICDRVLRLENLTAEFNEMALLEGYPVRLSVHDHDNSAGCNIGVGELNATSRALIQEVYQRDFENFDYSMSE